MGCQPPPQHCSRKYDVRSRAGRRSQTAPSWTSRSCAAAKRPRPQTLGTSRISTRRSGMDTGYPIRIGRSSGAAHSTTSPGSRPPKEWCSTPKMIPTSRMNGLGASQNDRSGTHVPSPRRASPDGVRSPEVPAANQEILRFKRLAEREFRARGAPSHAVYFRETTQPMKTPATKPTANVATIASTG